MGKTNYAKSPLLYIQQPKIYEPQAPMQHHYTTANEKLKETGIQSERQNDMPNTKTSRASSFKGKHTAQMKETNTAVNSGKTSKASQFGNNSTQSDDHSSDRVKFKDMSIGEKIEYLRNTPSHIIKMRCEIQTDAKKYRGMISDGTEDEIFMKIGNRAKSTGIKIMDIRDIRLLGF